MEQYGTVLSKRVKEILKKYTTSIEPINDTKKFIYEMLGPTPDRKDMIYRYEHTIRVAQNGAIIAENENLPKEPLIIACLLHDVGYRECATMEELHKHQFISADIAKVYLENIGYDQEWIEEMVKGIARHNLTDTLPEDMTPFQMSVRDSDDIDRFDMIRTAMVMRDCVHDKTNVEIIESCNNSINRSKLIMSYQRGTETAQKMINADCEKRISLLQDIIEQAQKGFERN